MKIEHGKIEKELSRTFKNIKKLKSVNIVSRSENHISIKTNNNLVTIKKDETDRVYKFYRSEEKHKVTEDKKILEINISDDPAIEVEMNDQKGSIVLSSLDFLKKHNQKINNKNKPG